jgi:hypothetical protein
MTNTRWDNHPQPLADTLGRHQQRGGPFRTPLLVQVLADQQTREKRGPRQRLGSRTGSSCGSPPGGDGCRVPSLFAGHRGAHSRLRHSLASAERRRGSPMILTRVMR